MKVKVEKKINDNKFIVELYTMNWTKLDLDLITKYEDPLIDLGGTLTEDDFTVEYPHKYRRIYSESPFVFIIDNGESAETTANVWTNVVLARMQTAIESLRSQDDTFTNQSLVEL